MKIIETRRHRLMVRVRRFMRSTLMFLGCVLLSVQGQDIHFSQYQFAPMTINPALAGAEHQIRGIVLYRSQWETMGFPYKTIQASYDMRLGRNKEKGFWGVGFQLFSDRAGEVSIRSNQAALSVGYHIRLNKNSTVGAGLLGGFQQNSLNYDQARWGSQYDHSAGKWNGGLNSRENVSNEVYGFFDPGLGLVYRYTKNESYMTGNDQMTIVTGLAMYHLYRPGFGYVDILNDRLYSRVHYFVKGLIGIPNSRFLVSPGVYMNMQGPSRELLVGSYFKYLVQEPTRVSGYKDAQAISLGGFYRGRDAVSVQFLMEWANYSVGMAYDINVSQFKIGTTGRGGFELMLRYVSPSPFGGGKSQARFFE